MIVFLNTDKIYGKHPQGVCVYHAQFHLVCFTAFLKEHLGRISLDSVGVPEAGRPRFTVSIAAGVLFFAHGFLQRLAIGRHDHRAVGAEYEPLLIPVILLGSDNIRAAGTLGEQRRAERCEQRSKNKPFHTKLL
jgi:hypothetical protein